MKRIAFYIIGVVLVFLALGLIMATVVYFSAKNEKDLTPGTYYVDPLTGQSKRINE